MTLNTVPVLSTPAEAINHIQKVILEKYQFRPVNNRVLEEMKAYIKSILSDFECTHGFECTHDIEVVQDPNDITHILIREPMDQMTENTMWTDEDWYELVNKQDERLKQIESLITNIRNILTDAGIPDHEDVPLDKRVEMLAERNRNVVNLSKMSYVNNPADRDARTKKIIGEVDE